MSKVLLAVQIVTLALLMILVLVVTDLVRDRLNRPSELEIKMRRDAQIDRIRIEYKACRARGEEVVFVIDGDVICVPMSKPSQGSSAP